jgi:UPF0755 protein
MAKTKKKGSGSARVILIILFVIALFLFKIFGPNTGDFREGTYLYIHTGSDYEALKKALTDGGFVNGIYSFDLMARVRKLPAHIHPGKYKIEKGMSNFSIVRMLRNGRQTPVKLVINKLRTKHDLVNLLSTNLEADSAQLKQLLHDPSYLSEFGLDTNTAMCAIIPDTYDFFWNSSADKAFRKLEKNYAKFWDETRKQQAKNQGLTPTKATVVASIVDEETNMNEDKPKIASVYLNRLNKGMKLQADPTVRYAIGDFGIRRVTGAMLEYNSPYNTYMYEGLPPGPICTPAASSVDAVLTAPKTTYLYFCAKDDFSGYTVFASTFDEQIKNAHAYQKALDARGIH